MFARPFIDSISFARNGEELCGEIPVVELSRLGDVLANHEGALVYTLRGVQEADRYELELALKGWLGLRCQRCLGVFPYQVDIVSRLLLLPPSKLDELDADDSLDGIEAAQHLDVVALIEDEVLLALPFAPKHPEGDCGPEMIGLTKLGNPFAVLAGLKRSDN